MKRITEYVPDHYRAPPGFDLCGRCYGKGLVCAGHHIWNQCWECGGRGAKDSIEKLFKSKMPLRF